MGALLITAALSAGCGATPGSSRPTARPTSAPVVPSASSSSASPTPLASLPDVPAGLPVMPDAEPIEVDAGVMARWLVDAIGPQVYHYYLDALPAAGFVVTDRFPGGGAAVVRFTTPDGVTLDLSLVAEGAGASRTRIELRPADGP